jgi:hypothetical protein
LVVPVFSTVKPWDCEHALDVHPLQEHTAKTGAATVHALDVHPLEPLMMADAATWIGLLPFTSLDSFDTLITFELKLGGERLDLTWHMTIA